MKDVGYATPGMMVQEFGPGRQVIYMRGVANNVGDTAVTSVYLDEVPVTIGGADPAGIAQLDLHTVDLARVEVLKGPQGTLYGAGAIGGTVRFITASPELDRFSGNGELTSSFTEDGNPSGKLSAVVNAPVVENVFGLRLAAAAGHEGGWIDRPSIGRSNVNGTDLKEVRLKGLWRPSAPVNVEGMVIVHRNHDGDSGGINHSDSNGDYEIPVDPTRKSPFNDDYELYNLTASYDFTSARLLPRHSATG